MWGFLYFKCLELPRSTHLCKKQKGQTVAADQRGKKKQKTVLSVKASCEHCGSAVNSWLCGTVTRCSFHISKAALKKKSI